MFYSLFGEILQRQGYDVKIVDCQFYNMTKEEYRKEIEDYRPDVVGNSILTTEYADTTDIAANIVKEIDPSNVTIMGGVYVTTQHKRAMRNPNVDYCVGISEEKLDQIRKNTRNRLTFENFNWSTIDTSLDEIKNNRAKAFSE